MRIGTVKEIFRYAVKSMAGEKLDECTVGTLGIPGDRGWALRDETTGEITNAKKLPLLLQYAAHYREPPRPDFIPHADMTLPDGTTLGTDAHDVNARLSRLLDRPVSLWPLRPADDLEHYRRRSKTARAFAKLMRFKAFRAALPTLTSFGPAQTQLREGFSREPGEPLPDLATLPPELIEFTSPLGTYFDAFPIHLLTTASLDEMARLNPSAQWDRRRFRPNFLIETDAGIHGLIEAEWDGRTVRVGGVELKCELPTVRCGMTIQAQAGLPKDPSVLRTIVRDANQNLGIYASVALPGEIRVGDPVTLS